MIVTWLLRGLAAWGLLFGVLLTVGVLADGSTTDRAIIGMAWLLVIVWVGVGGTLMGAARPVVARWGAARPRPRALVFVAGATLLALLEEASAWGASMAAPLFGVARGEAAIVATLNYATLVTRHSVVVFVPMFAAWAWLRHWRAFDPTQTLLLFGLAGTLGETLAFGPQMLLGVGQWVFVYGLMVWLPAVATPAPDGLRAPGPLAHLVALGLPLVATLPVVVLLTAVR